MASSQGTDLKKWKLHVDHGRQVWEYTENQSPEDQKMYDKYFLGLDTVRSRGGRPNNAAQDLFAFLRLLPRLNLNTNPAKMCFLW